MLYYPEMGEVAAPRLFKTGHNYGDSYHVEWLPEAHDLAMQTLKTLRIKAKGLQFNRVGVELTTSAKSDKWSCLVTGTSHTKLFNADLCAHEQLLD